MKILNINYKFFYFSSYNLDLNYCIIILVINMDRLHTRSFKIGNVQIGGQNKVLIQSMCNIKTSKYNEVINQILELEKLGCDIIRVSIMDKEDADAIKYIKPNIHIPLVGDIHFDYRLALLAMDNGIDKIRINPGNIGGEENVKKVINKAKEKHVAIRIGVNSGSLDEETLKLNDDKVTAKGMVDLAEKYIKYFEKENFYNIVISLKASSVLTSIEAYKEASKRFNYPLHLGITEAGGKDIGLIRSSAGLAPLLLEGIGDTIRISLSCEPKEEIIAAKRLLHDLGLYPNYPTLISCPTCGRTQVDIFTLSNKIANYLETVNKNITVAVMGCIVNGPGEGKHADIGLAGGKETFVLFKKGQIVKKINENEAFDVLKEEIDKF